MPLYKDPKNAVGFPGLGSSIFAGFDLAKKSKWTEFKGLLERLHEANQPDSPSGPFGHLVIFLDQSGHINDNEGNEIESWRDLNQMLKKLRKLAKKVKSEPVLPICADCGMPVQEGTGFRTSEGKMVHSLWSKCCEILQARIQELEGEQNG